jgi:hypothetical protein
MDRVSDVLTAAFTRTNTDLRSLGDTMKYAGPVASKLGISLEEAPGWRVFWLTTGFAVAMLVQLCELHWPALHPLQPERQKH